MNFQLFLIFILGLFGFDYNAEKRPVNLHKVDKNNHRFFSKIQDEIEAWMIRHASFCLLVLFIILSALFAAAMFAICGVSATESNNYYYHLR